MMSTPPEPDVSQLIEAVRGGDNLASDKLFEAVHSELRGLAAAVFRGAQAGHTLQPTALVNEAWLRMAGGIDHVEGRHHFFALAARAMRHVLADHARGKSRQKRGGNAARVSLTGEVLAERDDGFDLIAFNDALDQLAILNEQLAKIAELRVLGALTIAEVVDILSLDEWSVKRDWKAARLWLLKELHGT